MAKKPTAKCKALKATISKAGAHHRNTPEFKTELADKFAELSPEEQREVGIHLHMQPSICEEQAAAFLARTQGR